jgi:broad-specificity NMP kinase
MQTTHHLIIIRGTPGAGKSSLGRRLKKSFPPGVLIEIDNVRGMMNNVDWNNDQQHFIALEAAAATANSFIASGTLPVIVVDMFMPGKLEFFLEKISSQHYKIVSLLVNEEVLGKRLTDRKEGFKDIPKGNQLNQMLIDHPVTDEIQIDTSTIGKNEVMEICLQQL